MHILCSPLAKSFTSIGDETATMSTKQEKENRTDTGSLLASVKDATRGKFITARRNSPTRTPLTRRNIQPRGSTIKSSTKTYSADYANLSSPMTQVQLYRKPSSSRSPTRLVHAQRSVTQNKQPSRSSAFALPLEPSTPISGNCETLRRTLPVQTPIFHAGGIPLALEGVEFPGQPTANASSRAVSRLDGLNEKVRQLELEPREDTLKAKRALPSQALEEANTKRRKVVFSRCPSNADADKNTKVAARNGNPTAPFDARWMEKEELCLAKWLNYILLPNCDICPSTISSEQDDDIFSSRASHLLSLSTVPNRRQSFPTSMDRCKQILNSNKDLLMRLEKEVDDGFLAIREDKHLYADVGVRQNVINLLMCYSPAYLKLALEILFDISIKLPRHGSPSVKLGQVISQNLLFDKAIAAKHEGAVKKHYGPGFKPELDRFILKKFFTLVWLLEQMRLNSVLPDQPCLFHKQSTLKSSKAIVITFCKEYMANEGDIVKHLMSIGLNLCYEQTFLEEFDYKISSIATDLRDGVRLAKLADLLSSRKHAVAGVCQRLRVPPISRLQKIHNVELCLQRFKEIGVHVDHITAREIVDGHRTKTLDLLWSIVTCVELPHIVSVEAVAKEIERIRRVDHLMGIRQTNDIALTNIGCPVDSKFNDPLFGVLLDWASLVCSRYGKVVDNLTTSFSDGKALCYIINFYCPELLPLEHIKETLQDMAQAKRPTEEVLKDMQVLEQSVDGNWVGVFSPPKGLSTAAKLALQGEKLNFVLVREAIQNMGRVPYLVCSFDMSNTIPNAKVVALFLAYLCTRLLDIRHERLAAIKIQRCWRNWYKKNVLIVREKAAIMIQKYARVYLARIIAHQRKKQKLAAAVIANRILAWKERRAFLRLKSAAIKIQAWWRGVQQRRLYISLQTSCVRIQALFRAKLARRSFLQLRAAALTLQAVARGYLDRQQVRRIESAIVIQSWWRMITQRRQFLELKRKVTLVQSQIRQWRARRQFNETKRRIVAVQALARGVLARRQVRRELAAQTIQAWWRGIRQRRSYVDYVKSVTKAQSIIRGALARRYVERCRAALKLQAWWRAIQQRRKYLHERQAIILVQSAIRGKLARLQVKREIAAIAIQSWWKALQQKKNFVQLKQAALTAQRLYRGKRDREIAKQMKAAIKIQSWWRTVQQRRDFIRQYALIIKLQAHWRGAIARKQFVATKHAAMVLQRHAIGYLQRVAFQRLRKAAILAQSLIRGKRDRQYARCVKAAVKIQAWWRSVQCRKEFNNLRHGALMAQRQLRMILARRRYLQTVHAIIRLQAAIRAVLARRYVQRVMAAVKIQAWWKMVRAREAYLSRLAAARTLQRVWRGCIDRMQVKRILAARKIQAWWKMVQARNEFQQYRSSAIVAQKYARRLLAKRRYEEQKAAAIILQRQWRKVLAIRTLEMLNNSTTKIQAWWRMVRQRQTFLKLRQASICVQSYWRMAPYRDAFITLRRTTLFLQNQIRGVLIRRRYTAFVQSIIRIQALARGKLARIHAKRERAAVKIQACYRAFAQRQQYYRYQSAAILLQSVARGVLARRQAKREMCARKIQAWWRAVQQRREFLEEKRKIILVQALARGILARNHARRERAALKIQAWWKGIRARMHYKQLQKASLTLQRIWRGQLDRALVKRIRAAVQIQAWWRMVRERRLFTTVRNAAILAQSRIRCVLALRQYIALRTSAIKIQALWRAALARRRYQNCTAASIVIQAWWRMISTKRKYLQQRQASITIQAWWRMIIQQRSFNALKSATIRVQSIVRMKKQQIAFQNIKDAACRIQAAWRGALAHRAAVRERAAIRIQSWWKALRARKEFLRIKGAVRTIEEYYTTYCIRKRFLQQRRAAIAIQGWYRYRRAIRHFNTFKRGIIAMQCRARVLVAKRTLAELKQAKWIHSITIIQKTIRGALVRKQVKEQVEIIVRMQALCRGILARRATHAAIAEMRHRIAEAARQVEEAKTLRTRTRVALETIIRGQRLSDLRSACVDLAVTTTYSEACAQQLIDMNAIPVIFMLVNELNRSEPHINIMKATLAVFVNISKFKKVALRVVDTYPNILQTLLNIMLKYKEYSPVVTSQAAEVITKLSSSIMTAPTKISQNHPAAKNRLYAFLSSILNNKQVDQAFKHLQQKVANDKRMQKNSAAIRNSRDAFEALLLLARQNITSNEPSTMQKSQRTHAPD